MVVVVVVDARFVAVSNFDLRSVNTCILGKVCEFNDVKMWYSNSLSDLTCLLQCYSVVFSVIDVALLCGWDLPLLMIYSNIINNDQTLVCLQINISFLYSTLKDVVIKYLSWL